jgi:zinc transporter, ZIP family
MTPSVLNVFLLATATAAATGLGALPFALSRSPGRGVLGLANALAAGLMMGASAGLLYEGAQVGLGRTLLGAGLGVAFVAVMGRLLHGHDDLRLGALRGADARRALLIVGVMTAHSITEGVGVGVSFGGGAELGLLITFVIALHNIPEGLAISLVLVPAGTPVWRAAMWSVISSLPQPLLAVPAFLAVEAFRPLLGAGLGFAAGAMIWMAMRELIPEALEQAPRGRVAAVAGVSAIALLAVQLALSV